MGVLASYLQQEFKRRSPLGWESLDEVPLLSREIEELLGYSSRADVVLQRLDGSRRLWIEFEVSRADPVANHAKFATSHLFKPQLETDVFISMVSSHVQRGRRNLAANAIRLMRQIGMNAFQTSLFPNLAPNEIKRINHLKIDSLSAENLDVDSELEKVFLISETVLSVPNQKIHFVGDLLEVLLNLRRWNQDLATDRGKELWGKRTITYFVYDSYSRCFAPSKFCAYVAISSSSQTFETEVTAFTSGMTVDIYATLDDSDRRFDGRRARMHLTKNLGMKMIQPEDDIFITKAFEQWLKSYSGVINIHPNGARFLVVPHWF